MRIVRIILALLLLPCVLFAMQLGMFVWSHQADRENVAITAHAAEHVHWGFFPNRLAMPQVLIIGDSIAGGYWRDVAWRLSHTASVDAWLTPFGEHEEKVLDDLRAVLKYRQYEVIQFNIGLHALGLTPEESLKRIEQYVEVLKELAPNAVLIWGTITPVTVQGDALKLDSGINPEIEQKNALLKPLMEKHGILINDLYGLMLNNLADGLADRFHYSAAGSNKMSAQTAALIRQHLPPFRGFFIALAEWYFLLGALTTVILLWLAGAFSRCPVLK